MKERLVTLVCALGALALFAVMFLKREGPIGARNEVPAPITSERRGGGYHAVMTWLESEGFPVISLRDRFDTLSQREDLPASGNLLIVTLPARTNFKTAEFVPLDRWVRAGNTLLVMSALADNPDWSARYGGFAWGDTTLLSGLEFESARMRDARLERRARPGAQGARATANEGAPDDEAPLRAFAEPERTHIVANRPHAYFQGVQNVVALSDFPRQSWAVKVPYEGFVLTLAHERENGEGALWTRPLGKGRIIVSGFGTLFTNRAIGLGDNARLLANIIAANVTKGGAILFDDVHQGLGASYDPEKFYRDRRLYITIGVLAALWFVWVLGSTRLRFPAVRTPVPREAELVRAAGGFLSRALPSHVAARQLLDNFFQRVRQGTGGLHDASPPWGLLERNPRVDTADLDRLRQWYTDAFSQRRVPLRPLHNLIVRLERQLAT